MGKLEIGTRPDPRRLTTIRSTTVEIPDPHRLVHLQFRRHAGCPICNTHLRTFTVRHDEVEAAGVHEVVVFYSTDEELLRYESELPFDVIGDPKRRLYTEFGVHTSAWALFHPRALAAGIRGAIRFGAKKPSHGQTKLGLPADFLIGRDGTVLDRRYGTHAADQWSVDELLARTTGIGAETA